MTNKNLAPEIKPINTGITRYNTKQSKYDNKIFWNIQTFRHRRVPICNQHCGSAECCL